MVMEQIRGPKKDYSTLIEATALTEWSKLIEINPMLDTDVAKRVFMCGFTAGCMWTSTLHFVED
jgi:hypothetical protein